MALDKLVDSAQLDADLELVADAIREKGGTSEALLFPDEYITAIAAIQTGGGGNLTTKTVTPGDSVQIINQDTELRTANYTAPAVARTVNSSPSYIYPVVPSQELTANEEYALLGHIDVIDSNNNILESYAIDTTFIWSTTCTTIVENDENAYYSEIKFSKGSSATSAYIEVICQKAATYGFIAVLSIREISGYDGLSSVTVNPVKYSDTLIKNLITRSNGFANIEWPDNITTIGKYAFAACSYFNPSSLPSTLQTIDNYAFYGCTRLALTSLPSGVTSINDYAFYNCVQLALSSLPSNVTKIYSYTFFGCKNIEVSSLPSGLTILGASAFNGCEKITVSSIPNTITNKTVSSYCFKDCIGITTMNIPTGFTKIDSYAFQSCHNLVNLTLPDTITSISSYAFLNCRSLISVECNGAITTLSSSAFIANTSGVTMQLQSASFPYMVMSSQIGTVFGSTTAGYACKSLEFVDIGSTTGISSNAFANCYSLEILVLRKTASVCTLANVSAFTNTPFSGYDNKTGTAYVPQSLIASYKTATNWSTLYNNGTVTFEAIEGSDYELD